MNRVSLKLISKEECTEIKNIMIRIFEDEKSRWFGDGEPYIPGYNSEYMQNYHRRGENYYKILFDGLTAGVILISHTGREHGRIDRFYILPEFQGISIGSKVLKIIEEMNSDIKIWTLETTNRSPRNRHFYLKNGYEIVGEDQEDVYFSKSIGDKTHHEKDYLISMNYTGKNFRECTMVDCDFYHMQLSDSFFSHMNMSRNVYQNINLENTKFSNTNMTNCIVGDSNMADFELCHSSIAGANFHDLNQDSTRTDVLIERCNLEKSSIRDCHLKDVSIENCETSGMTIDGIDVRKMIEAYKGVQREFLHKRIKGFDHSEDVKSDCLRLLKNFHRDIIHDHTIEVAEECKRLAARFDINVEKIEMAAYLHDIGGIFANCERLEVSQRLGLGILDEERELPLILHQKISKVIAQSYFGVEDILILNSIECHTTLKANPSDYELILFIADKIKWDQKGEPPYLEEVKKGLDISLYHGAYAYIHYLMRNKDKLKVVHPKLREAYEFLKKKIN